MAINEEPEARPVDERMLPAVVNLAVVGHCRQVALELVVLGQTLLGVRVRKSQESTKAFSCAALRSVHPLSAWRVPKTISYSAFLIGLETPCRFAIRPGAGRSPWEGRRTNPARHQE